VLNIWTNAQIQSAEGGSEAKGTTTARLLTPHFTPQDMQLTTATRQHMHLTYNLSFCRIRMSNPPLLWLSFPCSLELPREQEAARYTRIQRSVLNTRLQKVLQEENNDVGDWRNKGWNCITTQNMRCVRFKRNVWLLCKLMCMTSWLGVQLPSKYKEMKDVLLWM
jgi:hypothetical protein